MLYEVHPMTTNSQDQNLELIKNLTEKINEKAKEISELRAQRRKLQATYLKETNKKMKEAMGTEPGKKRRRAVGRPRRVDDDEDYSEEDEDDVVAKFEQMNFD